MQILKEKMFTSSACRHTYSLRPNSVVAQILQMTPAGPTLFFSSSPPKQQQMTYQHPRQGSMQRSIT